MSSSYPSQRLPGFSSVSNTEVGEDRVLHVVVAVLVPCSSFSCYKGHRGHCPSLLHGPGSSESFRRCPILNMPYFQVVGVCWMLSVGGSALPKWEATSWKLRVESWRR